MTLDIRDVSKTYSNGVQALKDVTLTIPTEMRADSVGRESEVPIDDLVELGVFAPDGDKGFGQPDNLSGTFGLLGPNASDMTGTERLASRRDGLVSTGDHVQ